ncbi:MAG: hypothetical protein AAGB14_00345 [Verrucomicrobiota bacterium]
MPRYKVTDPKGVLVGTKTIKKGDLVPDGFTGSQLKAWQRFGQVKKVEVKEPQPADPDAEAKAKGNQK